MRSPRFFLALACLAASVFVSTVSAAIDVTTLHPLMGDLARQVGGERVQVTDLVKKGVNPHRFEPRPSDLRQLGKADLVLAAGKGMEPYLDRVRAAVGEGVPVVEVGRTIPSLTVGKDAVYTCCPHHHSGSIDPHWWHGVENMRRAARVVAKELGRIDPAGEKMFDQRAAAYGRRLEELKKWAKRELGRIPRTQRKLVTSHTALAYFAKEFGFEIIAVGGVNREQNLPPHDLAKAMEIVRKERIPVVFPEHSVNASGLKALARDTGTRLAHPLDSDGVGHDGEGITFEGMVRHNVGAIVAALAPSR